MTFDDEEFLRALNADSRISFRKLAKRLKLAPGTAISQVKRLEKSGVIMGYRVEVDYDLLGYKFICFIDAQVGPNDRRDFEEYLKRSKRVVSAYRVTGAYDYLLFTRLKTKKELREFITSMSNAPGVIKTRIKITIDPVKEDYCHI